MRILFVLVTLGVVLSATPLMAAGQVPPLSGAVMQLQTANAELQKEIAELRAKQADQDKVITDLRNAAHQNQSRPVNQSIK